VLTVDRVAEPLKETRLDINEAEEFPYLLASSLVLG